MQPPHEESFTLLQATSSSPLGTLSEQQINKGFATLLEVQRELKSPMVSKSFLQTLTSRFFQEVPHDMKFKSMQVVLVLWGAASRPGRG